MRPFTRISAATAAFLLSAMAAAAQIPFFGFPDFGDLAPSGTHLQKKAYEFDYDLDFQYLFDNREFNGGKQKLEKSQTLNAARVIPWAGIRINQSSTVTHRIMAGAEFTHDMGAGSLTVGEEGLAHRGLSDFEGLMLYYKAEARLRRGVFSAVAGIYSGKKPSEVFKHYGPAYLTAVGTMSSAATLSVALECAHKSSVLRKDMVDFGIPLFANIHLCGSVLTEVFFCMTISLILYGTLPSAGTMLLFCLLLGIFAIGAPGVPGGTVMASLGLVTGVLGFDGAGTALVLAIFALQDSFGTACNVTGDGALTLILTGYADRKKL